MGECFVASGSVISIALPGSDVKVEYDEDKKMLHITNLPRDLSVPNVFQAYDTASETEEVYILWGVVGEPESH